MRYLSVAISALLSTAAVANHSTREATLQHWEQAAAEKRSITSRDAVLDAQGNRYERVAVDGLTHVLKPVTEGTRRRGLLESLAIEESDCNSFPCPATGSSVEYSENAMVFAAEVSFADVGSLHLKHSNPDHDTEVGAGLLNYDSSKGVAWTTLAGLKEGSYTWYFESTDGTEQSDSNKLTITEALGEVVRQSATGGATTVAEAEWTFGGDILSASGRIYYSSYGFDYACSGTAFKDNKSGRSLILTAAHCTWDDIDGQWGSNVIFIPNRDAVNVQEGETAADIHRACSEDICGCWTASAGFVHSKWQELPWPDRLKYDYGIWVVDDFGSHEGQSCGSDALDVVVDELEFGVGEDLQSKHVHALGYTLAKNPDFRYCADTTTINQPDDAGLVDTWWLDSCGLKGGASGGPWVADMDESTGSGTIVSVSVWSFENRNGMGGPIIDASEGRCLVNYAREADFEAIEARGEAEQGDFVYCEERPCIDPEEAGAEGSARKLRGGRRLCD